MKQAFYIIFLGMLFSLNVFANSQAFVNSGNQGQVHNEFYTINEKFKSTSEEAFNLIPSEFTQLAESIKSTVINLLSWTLHERPRPTPTEDYNRKFHFGRWINDPTDDTCMNTRAKVLVRDSEAEVTFRNQKNCVVESGKWYDRYSNSEHTSSREVQIDHMVPLKAAYMAGAFKWDYKTRCLFANYMGFRNHLIPASVRENTSKGDRAPDKYLPTELSYRCQYIKDWLTIKLIWKLNLIADEVEAVHEVMMNYGCNPDSFKIITADLEKQREHIKENIEFCTINQR